jgi:hypothetical protein
MFMFMDDDVIALSAAGSKCLRSFKSRRLSPAGFNALKVFPARAVAAAAAAAVERFMFVFLFVSLSVVFVASVLVVLVVLVSSLLMLTTPADELVLSEIKLSLRWRDRFFDFFEVEVAVVAVGTVRDIFDFVSF